MNGVAVVILEGKATSQRDNKNLRWTPIMEYILDAEEGFNDVAHRTYMYANLI